MCLTSLDLPRVLLGVVCFYFILLLFQKGSQIKTRKTVISPQGRESASVPGL